MKKQFLLFICCFWTVLSSAESFQFAIFTDLHISEGNPRPSHDLTEAVEDVNTRKNVDFVLVTGDLTETGNKESLLIAKKILDGLNVPYYATAGNHETKWSESGVTDFARVFGDDKFDFEHKGCYFIGFTTGPVIKMGDGHIAPQDISWLHAKLKQLPKNHPIFVATHYPLQTGDVDNWCQMTDILRQYNIQTLLGGHYHRNTIFNYDGICGVLHRSTLRDKDSVGGYSILAVSDSIRFFEQKTGNNIAKKWLTIPFENHTYDAPNTSLRPSFDINKEYPQVKEKWRLNIGIGIYSTPAICDGNVLFGDDLGNFYCLNEKNGKEKWKIATGSRIISSPAVCNNKVVFGSTDGHIYCLNTKNGKEEWKIATKKAVLGNALIENNTVYIGGSDGCFRAIDLQTGNIKWAFCEVGNYIETRPVIYNDKIYFGAWDSYLYALNIADGSLAWKWNNGNLRVHFSPAAVLPVASNGKIFITAPDRYWTAIDAETGKIVWRTKQHVVRETIGLSEDKKTVFSRCMNDSVVAIDATGNTPQVIWKTNAAYGYDHNPSMLIERDEIIVFGTKNGLLHGIDSNTGSVLWKYKIGNSIINTIAPISGKECIISTSEGVVAKIEF